MTRSTHSPSTKKTRPALKRKRGAQPGNSNAVKHGFYSHRFNALELKDLDTVLQDNLVDEIALVRVTIRRVFEYADTEAESLADWEAALNTLGASSIRLAGLLRTQKLLTGSGGDVVSLISEAIGEISHELGVIKS